VLQALVRKTELIRTQLGSAGQVIAHRVSDRLQREGITQAKSLATEIDRAGDEELQKTATAEMDDATEARRARQAKEIDGLREVLEQSREKVGVDPDELRSVFATALARAGTSLDASRAGEVGGTPLFRPRSSMSAAHPVAISRRRARPSFSRPVSAGAPAATTRRAC
jgi:hypothetical protein